MIPPEIHLMILEFYLGDKSLYNQDSSEKRMSISDWINLSLVCCAWKTRIYSLVFNHLSVEQQHLSGLQDVYATLIRGCGNPVSYPAPRPALSFVSTLTIHLPHPVCALPNTMFILEQAPNLSRLSLEIDLKLNTERMHATRTPQLQQVECFSLRFSYVPFGFYLPWRAKDVQWILACVPDVKHILFDMPRQLCEADDGQAPVSLPSVVSIQSNCWVEWLVGPDTYFPNLRFLEVSGDPSSDNSKFLDRHSAHIDSLTLGDVNHGWADLIPRFQPMRHLALSYVYNFPWRLVQLPYLSHFEFLWLGRGEEDSWIEILEFLGNCLSLEVITYHSQLELPLLGDFCRQRSIQYIWRQRKFHDDWRVTDQGSWLYAIPYASWKDVAFYAPPPPPMTVWPGSHE